MANAINNIFFKKSSSFFFCAVVMAFGLEAYVNVTADKLYNTINRGLLWEHIKDNYKKP